MSPSNQSQSQFHHVKPPEKTDRDKRERAKNEEAEDALKMQREGALQEK